MNLNNSDKACILRGMGARGLKAGTMTGLYTTNSRLTTDDINTGKIENIKKSSLYIRSWNDIPVELKRVFYRNVLGETRLFFKLMKIILNTLCW